MDRLAGRQTDIFLHHKMTLRPQLWPQLAKNTSSQNNAKKITFRSVRGPDRCQIGKRPLCFQQVTLSKIIRLTNNWPEMTQQVLHWRKITQKIELANKNPSQNHPQNSTFRSVKGPDDCYIRNQPLYFY